MITIDKSVLHTSRKFSDLNVGDTFIVNADLDSQLCIKTREVFFSRETKAAPGNCVELANGYVWHLSGDANVQPVNLKVIRA